MKPGVPWQVKGVRVQARETAREAARRSGKSVGQWLDTVILDSAVDEGVEPVRRPNPDHDERPPAGFDNQPRYPDLDEYPRPRRRTYADYDQRQGRVADEHLAGVNDRLDMLSRQIDQRAGRAADGELAAVKDRLDTLVQQFEQRQASEEHLAAVKNRLDTLAQQLDQRQSRVPDDGLAAVHDRLETLARQVDQRQTSEEHLAAVKDRLDMLAQQFDQRQSRVPDDGLAAVHDRLETLARQVDQRQSQGSDENLAAVNERLDTLVLAVDQLVRLNGATADRPAQPASEPPRQFAEEDPAALNHRLDQPARPFDRRQNRGLEDDLLAVKERLDALNRQLEQREGRLSDQDFVAVSDHLDTPAQQFDPRQSVLADEALAAVNERLDTLVHAVEQLVSVNVASAERLLPDPSADDMSRELAEAISRLDQRLDQLIVEGRSATLEIEERVSAVDRAVAQINRESLRPVVAEPPSPQPVVANPTNPHPVVADPPSPLDQALIEIAARQRALDGEAGPPRFDLSRPSTQNLSGLEQQLRQITTRIETMRPCGIDHAIETLRDDLAEIGLMLKEAMPRQAVEALEIEVRALAARIDDKRHAGVDGADIAGLERGLTEVRDALRALTPAENLVGFEDAVRALSQKIDAIPTINQDPATLDQLEGTIAALRGIVSHVASDDALAKLADEVRGLAAKVDQLASFDGFANLENQIATIADALQSRHQTSQDAHDLVAVVEGLTDKIERLQLTPTDHAAVGHLEDRIAKLVEKLDASDNRIGHLESIERGLAELLIQLEHQRIPAVAHAGAAESPEVNTLKHEVQRTQDSIEAVHGTLKRDVQRTQDSIEAVNGTLGHLVDRLAMIESGLRNQGLPKAPTVPAAPPRPAVPPRPAPPESPIAAVTPATPPTAGAPGNPAPSTDRERRPIDPTLPPDHPLEPDSGVNRGHGGNSPADRIAASEAALGSAKPPMIPDPAGKSNFIAAARRAAKVATAEVPARSDKQAGSAAGGRLAGFLSRRVRSLFVATSVVLIVLGSLHVVANLFSGSDELDDSAPTLPAQQASAPDAGSVFAPEPASTPTPSRPAGPALPADRLVTGSIRQPDSAATTSLPSSIGSGLGAAAVKGDPAAQYEVAVRFAEGRGVPQDLTAAAEWFERAAKQGLTPAQFRLGGLNEKGLGVPKNPENARRLYLAAAEAGNAKAMHNLAVLYAEGFDGKPDYPTAAKWFRKAADHGMPDSQYNLGILHARGIGVEVNLAEAYKWFTLAARDGDKDATAKRDDVGGRIDQKALMAARAAAQVWTAMPQPEAAVQVKAPAGGWDTPAPAAPVTRRGGPKVDAAPQTSL
jgi:localization factor PodJL